MDIFSRTIYAPRIDLSIALLATLISASIGGGIGAFVGFYSTGGGLRPIVSYTVMRSANILQAFPVFVSPSRSSQALGQSVQTVIIAIAFVNIPIYLLLMRGQVLAIRGMPMSRRRRWLAFPTSAPSPATSSPTRWAPVLAQMSIDIGWSVLLTAGLASSAPACRPPTPEWGSMIAMGFQNVVTGQWLALPFPRLGACDHSLRLRARRSSIEVLADPMSAGRSWRRCDRTGRRAAASIVEV